MANSTTILLPNVRLSYPNLFVHEQYEGKSTGNFSATFLIPKDREELIEKLWDTAMATAAEAFGGVKKVPKRIQTSDRCCIRDGDLTDDENYEGHLSLKAMTNKNFLRLDRAKEIVTLDDGDDQYNGIFYPGCYVDAKINFWVTQSYGEIRSNLLLVRFRADGERLGSGGVDKEELMEDLEDLDDDVDL